MSSLDTIASCDAFHLANEMWNERTISLEIETTHFSASHKRIVFTMPVHVWEVLRQYPGIKLDLLGLSGTELRQRVEQEVDERRRQYRKAKAGMARCLVGGSGLLVYGSMTSPRAKQIKDGLSYYRTQQREQQKIQAEIEKLRWELSPEAQRKRQAAHNRKAARLYAKRRLSQKKPTKAKARASTQHAVIKF